MEMIPGFFSGGFSCGNVLEYSYFVGILRLLHALNGFSGQLSACGTCGLLS
jgi:hypothetical protein